MTEPIIILIMMTEPITILLMMTEPITMLMMMTDADVLSTHSAQGRTPWDRGQRSSCSTTGVTLEQVTWHGPASAWWVSNSTRLTRTDILDTFKKKKEKKKKKKKSLMFTGQFWLEKLTCYIFSLAAPCCLDARLVWYTLLFVCVCVCVGGPRGPLHGVYTPKDHGSGSTRFLLINWCTASPRQSVYLYLCLSLSMSLSGCLPLSVSVFLCPCMCVCVSLCFSLSLCVSVFVCFCPCVCVCVCVCVCLSLSLSVFVWPCVCPYVFVYISLTLCMWVSFSMCVSVCLSFSFLFFCRYVSLSVFLCLCLSVSVSLFVFLCPCVCVSLSLSPSVSYLWFCDLRCALLWLHIWLGVKYQEPRTYSLLSFSITDFRDLETDTLDNRFFTVSFCDSSLAHRRFLIIRFVAALCE